MPTPIKYYNPRIKETYKEIESIAADRLLSTLPDELAAVYRPYFIEQDKEILQIVKAADKISALIKCIEEIRMGNHDFIRARQAQLDALSEMHMPAADTFLAQFLPAYELTLDEMDLSKL